MCETPRASNTSENGAIRPTSDFPQKRCGTLRGSAPRSAVGPSLDHDVVLMICSTKRSRTLFRKKTLKTSRATPTATAPRPSSSKKFRLGNDGRNVQAIEPQQPCVGNKKDLASSLCTGWSPQRRGSTQPVGRPTRDDQVLKATRRSPIIGLNTLPLQTPG